MESEVWSVKCGVWSVIWEVRSVVWSGVWGASPNSLYAVRLLIQYSLAESPTFASSPNGIEAEDLHRLPFVTCLRPYFSLHSSFLWLPGAPTSDWLPWSQNCPQCVSTLSVLLHLCCLHWSWYFTLALGKGIVSHHLSVSSLRCVFCFPSCGYFGTKVFSSFLSPSPFP